MFVEQSKRMWMNETSWDQLLNYEFASTTFTDTPSSAMEMYSEISTLINGKNPVLAVFTISSHLSFLYGVILKAVSSWGDGDFSSYPAEPFDAINTKVFT